MKAPLDELSTAHAVVLEAPSIVTARFEHDMLALVQKIRTLGPEVAIIVQPSLRRRSNKTLWVHRWNRLHHIPFKFHQTCSCKLGNKVPGCHLTCLVGATTDKIPMSPCGEVPTLSATPTASVLSLGGSVSYIALHLRHTLCARLGLGYRAGETVGTLLSLATPPGAFCCRPVSDGRHQSPRSIGDLGQPSGSQRTPNSAQSPRANSALLQITTAENSAHDRVENSVPITHDAYPTDAKEREKNRRKQEKEAGIERVVKKRKKIMEDHYDDCGEDLSSLHDKTTTDFVYPCDFDTDDALSDDDRNQCLKLQFGAQIQSYPVDLSKVAPAQPGGGPSPDPNAVPKRQSTCPGCRHSRESTDWEHTREIGQCSYPYTEPWIPECMACQDRKQRYHPDHTYEFNKCKWAAAPHRQYAPRATRRSSRRPHEPVPATSAEPTAGAPTAVEGRELGAEGEERVAQDDTIDLEGDPGGRREAEARTPGQSASSSSGVRGPDREQRDRRTYRDQGDNPESPQDWTEFDIGRVIRIFRTNREAAIRLSLRKLHVRWWHASKHTMRRFLERAGVADKVLDLIPEICDTCRVCREWAKPGPSNACSVDMTDKFNQQVECDLMFVHKHIIFHMIDRCTRWHAALVVPNKEDETLIKAIDTGWVTIHGAPKELISDGETGIVVSQRTRDYLSRKGITLHIRGKDQHARFIERRGAL